MSNTEALGAANAPAAPAATFQARVGDHLNAVTEGDPTTLEERCDRHFEEEVELQQAVGASRERLHAIVDYVCDRPAGNPALELGAVMTTLAGLATYANLDMMTCGEAELARTWSPEVFAKIRRKRAARHGRGPLPGMDGDLVTTPADDITPEAVAATQARADTVTSKTGKESTWDEGVDYALTQLCAMLDVDPAKVSWDAATETAEGDVRSVIGNILRTWAADDWQDLPAIREMMLGGQGDDDGSHILPDFQEDMTAHAMVAACVHLLERRRDALDGHAKAKLAPPPAHPELDTLRDLAHVLDAQIEEGVIVPDGMGLVIAALARAKPEFIHTGERCTNPECLVHGPCDECPTEAQYRSLDALLTTWLAEHPREAVIHKTASVGKTELLPDLRPWQPAGTYPQTGAHIELEDGKRVRFAMYRPLYQEEYVTGWLLYLPDAAPAPVWVPSDSPAGRWRHASALEA